MNCFSVTKLRQLRASLFFFWTFIWHKSMSFKWRCKLLSRRLKPIRLYIEVITGWLIIIGLIILRFLRPIIQKFSEFGIWTCKIKLTLTIISFHYPIKLMVLDHIWIWHRVLVFLRIYVASMISIYCFLIFKCHIFLFSVPCSPIDNLLFFSFLWWGNNIVKIKTPFVFWFPISWRVIILGR